MTSRPRRPRLPLGESAGVSLLELVMALSLLALALGGIYAFVVSGQRSATVTNSFLQTQAQVRAGLDNFVDEVRWAQNVTAASATSVTVFVPQGTPFAAGGAYSVTFAYDRARRVLTRQEGTGAIEDLAVNVVREDGSDGILFEYFDAAGTALGSAPAVLSDVARIRLTMTTTVGDITRTFAGDAALRAR